MPYKRWFYMSRINQLLRCNMHNYITKPTLDINHQLSDTRVIRGCSFGGQRNSNPVLVFNKHPKRCPLKKRLTDYYYGKLIPCTVILPDETKRSGFPVGESRYKKLCWEHGQLYYDLKDELL